MHPAYKMICCLRGQLERETCGYRRLLVNRIAEIVAVPTLQTRPSSQTPRLVALLSCIKVLIDYLKQFVHALLVLVRLQDGVETRAHANTTLIISCGNVHKLLLV